MQTISFLKSNNLKCSTIQEEKLLLYPDNIVVENKKDYCKLSFHNQRLLIKNNRCFSTSTLWRPFHGPFLSGSKIPKNTMIVHRYTLLLALEFEYYTLNSSLRAIKNFLFTLERRYDNPNLSIIFQELLLNALEYGNLQITPYDKERLIEQNRYDQMLKQKESTKKIFIRMGRIASFLIGQIEDEGEGFSLYNYDKNRLFSGRGILLAKKLALALAYNEKGNCVTFLYRITQ